MSFSIENLEKALQNESDPAIALGQKAYMRNQFEFFGLKASIRRQIQGPFLSRVYLPHKKELPIIIKELWNKPQREFQLIGQELVSKYHRKWTPEDISLFEYMVIHKSWWDTVDYIAANLMGSYFKHYPESRHKYVNKWLSSGNLWLQRSALLFQLKYKDQLDTDLLSATINSLLNSNEFFINKAIGWVLREYSKTNPQWVEQFVYKTPLNPLSKREAMRIILAKK